MGNIIKEWVKSVIVEANIKREVVVYAGRFQPFHNGHYATYSHLVKKFGKENVFIGTSNQQGGPRHPFNFKEKREIMIKMFNIPSSQIVQVKNPYAPTEVISKFDESSTAFITVVGEKDEARLGGKYFKKYDGKPEFGYKEHGYVYVSPKQPNAISGTDVRNWLSATDDSQRKAGFKKAYPKFDPKIYNLISTRLLKVESIMEEFFKRFDIKALLEGAEYGADAGEPDTMFVIPGKTRKLGMKNPGQKDDVWFVNGGYTQMHFPKADVIIAPDAKGTSDYYQYSSKRNIRNNTDLEIPPVSDDFTTAKQGRKNVDVQDLKIEGSTMGAVSLDMVDNGPAFSWETRDKYEAANNEVAKRLGFEVVDWMIGSDLETQFVKDRPTQVSYYPKSNRPANSDYADWKSNIEKTATMLGMEFMKFLDEDITIPINIGDTVLGGKFKNKRVVVKSIGKNEKGDITINDKPLLKFRLIDKIDEGMLMEGGAYGHMAHPFDTEMNLTFGDLKQIIHGALNGELELAREKTDGQALAISWRDDKGGLIAARNKGHLANRGEKALDISGVASKFQGRGGLTDAYNFAMKDLTSAIKSLSKAQRDKIFKQGAKFMNLEVIWPTSVNVIPYGQPLLVFHNTTEYDESGVAIGAEQSDAKVLAGMIKQVNADVQSKYTIQGPPVQQLPKSQKLTSLKSKFESQLGKLQKEFNLKDTDGVAEYHQRWWENYVDTKSPSTIDNKTKMGLVKRWAFYDKSFRLDNKNITDSKVLEWAQGVDKNDHVRIAKDNIRPFEDIFLGVGAEVLSFMSSVLTVNPDTAVRNMKDRLDQTIKDVQKSGDPKKIAKLRLELERLAAIGGKDKIVPNEGIVFVYKGHTYKLTGTFAPLNQILGLFYE